MGRVLGLHLQNCIGCETRLEDTQKLAGWLFGQDRQSQTRLPAILLHTAIATHKGQIAPIEEQCDLS